MTIWTSTSRTARESRAEAIAERETRREARALESSFIEFFAGCWNEIDPAPLKLNWHHEAIAEHLEAVSYGHIKKLLVNMPPRHTKSLQISVAWPAWIWARETGLSPLLGPQVSFMCFSYSDALALDHALISKRLIQSDWYRRRWGRRVQVRADKEATSKFDLVAGGTRISTSMHGTTTGRGADYRIFDDPHSVKQVESQVIREETIRTYDQALKNRVTDPRTSVEVIVMQRSHENDLAGHVLASDAQYVHLMLPAEFEKDRHCITYVDGKPFWADPRKAQGELLWPEQWGPDELAPFKINEYLWAGQYLQRPAPPGGGVVKREWWQLWGDDTDPELLRPENQRYRKHPSYSFRLACLDTAYTEKEENDPSAMAVWGVFANDLGMPAVMLANAWKERLAFPDLLTRVVETCRKFKVDTLLIEDKTAGTPLEQEIRRYHASEQWSVEMHPVNRSSGDKLVRLHAVVPCFKAKQVWAPFKPWAEDHISEVAMFPKGRHDEAVDLTSMGLGWLRRRGLLDFEREIKEAEIEARRKPGGRVQPLYPGT